MTEIGVAMTAAASLLASLQANVRHRAVRSRFLRAMTATPSLMDTEEKRFPCRSISDRSVRLGRLGSVENGLFHKLS